MQVPLENVSQFYILSPQTDTNDIEDIQIVVNESDENGINQLQTLEELNSSCSYNSWSTKSTKALIYAYKIHKPKVGSFQIKNLKMMWEVISRYLLKNFNLKYTSTNCENRWRVLERNYKKYVDNNNRTGRGRKYFEFAQEMDEIFLKKRNINPEILLSSNQEIKHRIGPTADVEEKKPSEEKENEQANIDIQENCDIANISKPISSGNAENQERGIQKTNKQVKLKRKLATVKTKTTLLDEIRNDRLKYQTEILKLQQKRNEEKMEIEREKLTELKRKNDLIEKRNMLLEELLKKENVKSGDVPLSLL